MTSPQLDRVTWWTAEADLLRAERAAVETSFPGLEWVDVGAGSWIGQLPPWPFERPAPEGLMMLLGDAPFVVNLMYGHAFPASPPVVFPLEPTPPAELRSFTDYHVLGDGSLCLLRDADQWTTSSRTTDLILKAAGWRIEYALLQLGKLDKLTESGIVVDTSLDPLIDATIREIRSGS